jgi:hypothetical protein
MRQKLNENPVAQIALVGVLLVLVAFFFLTKMGGGEESETASAPPAIEAPAGEVPAEEAAPTPAGTSSAGDAVAVPGTAPEIAAATTSTSAPADRAMPPKLERAYAGDKTIALLIVRDGGIDDHIVREATEVLEDRPHVAFFSAKAKNIARFAQITGPLGVNQAPALVVIRPKHLNGKGPAPASVTYGFQTKNDVRQMVRDAIYRGRTLTYSPN